MNRLKLNFTFFLSLLFIFQVNAQTVSLFGYTFQENDRGFLNEVRITVLKLPEKIVTVEAVSNMDGEFKVQLPAGMKYLVRAEKDIFEVLEMELSTEGKTAGEKVFLKMEMERKPGYLFDATLAESRTNEDQVVDAIQGALIEIYNNTTGTSEKVLKDHPEPYFSHTFEQGNHYTIMIRKEGFLAKRIEAYINVKGCIICVDGVKKLGPGITDNLTAGFAMGTLLANIEMNKADLNSKIAIDNIYYDLNKWDIRPEAAKELDNVVTLMRDNPEINVELGSHTDARGGDQFNLDLSEKRAKAAVEYIVSTGKIKAARIKSKGYGETQLVNGCKNGVKCSDRKHQLNRRTDLKIIGFNEKKAWRSLEEMIREEQFQKSMEEIDNQDVVRISKDGKAIKEKRINFEDVKKTAPIEVEKPIVKKTIEAKKTTPEIKKEVIVAQSTPTVKDVLVEKRPAPVPEENVDPIIGMAIDSVRKHSRVVNKEHKIPTKTIEKVLMPTPVERTGTPAQSAPPAYEESSDKVIVNTRKTGSLIPPVSRRTRENEIMEEARKELDKINAAETEVLEKPAAPKLAEKVSGSKGDLIVVKKEAPAAPIFEPKEKIVERNEIGNQVGNNSLDNVSYEIASNYTGYKVEALRSKTALPDDHPIFSEYGGVYIERLPSGEYAYLLGDFKVKRIALYYLNNTVYDKFYTAKLVLFEDGKRR